MPTAESILKDKKFRKNKDSKQLKDLERFVESGKEKPIKKKKAKGYK